jgi:hypothetical protein
VCKRTAKRIHHTHRTSRRSKPSNLKIRNLFREAKEGIVESALHHALTIAVVFLLFLPAAGTGAGSGEPSWRIKVSAH